MHHRFDAVLPQHLGKTIGLGNITHDQTIGSIGHGRDVPLDKIVISDRIVTVMEQPAEACTPDVTGPPVRRIFIDEFL